MNQNPTVAFCQMQKLYNNYYSSEYVTETLTSLEFLLYLIKDMLIKITTPYTSDWNSVEGTSASINIVRSKPIQIFLLHRFQNIKFNSTMHLH